jgi:O-antigen/teichoic acid export membrane protein
MDEKFVRRFLKGSLFTSLGTMATIVFHFLSISFMTRYATKEALGLYFLMLALANAGKILSNLGLDLTLAKFLASEEEHIQQQTFAAILWTRLLTFGALTLVLYFGGRFILTRFDEGLIAYQWYLPALFALMSFRELFFYILQGLHQYKHYAFIQTSSAILKLLLTIIFRDSLDLTSLLWIEFAMLGGSLLLQFFVIPIRRLSPPRLMFQPAIMPQIFRFGFPLYTNSLLTYVSDFGGVYIIGLFLSPISIAAYEVSKKIPEGFSRLFTSFHVVYFPNLSALFAQKDVKNAQKLLNKSLILLSVLVFALVLFSLVFSYELVLLVFSAKYLDVQPAFVVIMLAVCLNLFANTMGYSLVAAGIPSYSTRVNMVAMGLELLLSLLLVPLMGYIGVGVAYVIMTLVAQTMCYFFLRNHASVQIDLRNFLKPWLFFILLGGIYLALGNQAFVWRIALLTAYVGLCVAFIPDIRQMLPYVRKITQDLKWQRSQS